MNTEKFLAALDKSCADLLSENTSRSHLGASVIGKRCVRAIWYDFRKAHITRHGGRLMRLFNRGHQEEHHIVRWLRSMDIEVQDYQERLLWFKTADLYEAVDWAHDWMDDVALGPFGYIDVSEDHFHIERATERGEGPRQWGFSDGLFAGSSDGQVRGLEKWFPNLTGWGLLECKTHSEKSFTQLKTKGVLSSKMEHYVQMQVYMDKLDLPWALYVAVNKNNDEIYPEIVMRRSEVGAFYADRAHEIIAARKAPPKLSEDPSWFECRYCDFREICHYDAQPHKSCRSCVFADAGEGRWRCHSWNGDVPADFILKGCDVWEPIS